MKSKKLLFFIIGGIIIVAGAVVAIILLTQKPETPAEPDAPDEEVQVEESWDEIIDRTTKISVCLEEKRLNGINYDDMTEEQKEQYWSCM